MAQLTVGTARLPLLRRIGRDRVGVAAATAALTGAGLTLALVPLVNGLALGRFTLDDAHINWRYSENLAAGHGLAWNHIGDATDGYTSFSWALLIGGLNWIGIDSEVAAKTVGAAATVALMLVLAFYGGRRLPVVRVIAVAGLALSPAFLVLTLQGSETALAALLATASAIFFIAAVERPGHRNLAAFSSVCVLAVLTRPDLFTLCAVLVAGLALWLVRERDGPGLRRASAWFGGAAVLGVAYFLWRWSYYGLPAPNTYYVKRSPGLINDQALSNLLGFLKHIAPYLVLVVGLYAWSWRVPSALRSSDRYAIGVVLAAVGLFLAGGLGFKPFQGFLWRFQMPAYPVLLLVLVLLASRLRLPPLRGRRRTVALTLGALGAVVLVAFPLHTVRNARSEVEDRWVYDREVVGKALAAYRDDGLRVLTSEAGALPLFSGWWASDTLGLNDEHIARHGASFNYLRRMSPDVVMFYTSISNFPQRRLPGRSLLRTGYVFATAIAKTDPKLRPVPNKAHYYFVKRSSPKADELVRTLRSLDDVRYVPRARSQALVDTLGLRD